MHILFVAIGTPAAKLMERDPLELLSLQDFCSSHVERRGTDYLAVAGTPLGALPIAASTPDASRALLVDGYIVPSRTSIGAMAAAADSLLAEISATGIGAALRTLRAGSYNLSYANFESREYLVASDPIGSIPLYFAEVGNGYILSTNPRALLATGLISDDIDWAASASWLYFGYPLRDRHFTRSIRVFPSHSVLRWRPGWVGIESLDRPFTHVVPSINQPSTGAIAERVKDACRSVATVPGRLGHLQSAGMDSRMILAALPTELQPPCFTYGRPDSTEIPVAEQVARVRGVEFHHYWPDGDAVAGSLDQMFEFNGLMVYPDRYLIAQQMSQAGIQCVTDGFLGDVLLGGSYYRCDQYFGRVSRIAHYALVYLDQSVAAIGLEAISAVLYNSMLEVRNLHGSLGFLRADFLEQIESQRPSLFEDVTLECSRLAPSNDSLGLLFRNFLMQNRSRQAIAQQGVMCRRFLQVLYPFTNDVALLDACLDMTPRATAYRRFYVRLFRDEFPEYAAVPYGESLIPLGKSPWAHNLHRMLGRTLGKALAATPYRQPVSIGPNNWSLWLSRSARLRETLADYLVSAGIAEQSALDQHLQRIARGEISGTGKLFHLAAVARWMCSPAAE